MLLWILTIVVFRALSKLSSDTKEKANYFINLRLTRIALVLNIAVFFDIFFVLVFSVVIGLQPIFQLARVPDSSYSSQYDCFHPSAKANAEISMTAWNSLQLPWDKKPRSNSDRFICPDENTLLQ